MSRKTVHILIIIIVIFSNLFFGLPRISQYTAVDETLWSYDRVPKFWRSVADGNWRGTNLCDKPGITLAIISGAGLPFIPDLRKYENLRFQPKTAEQLAMIEKIYFSLRLPVYLFALASLFAFYFLLKRLLSAEIALLTVIFIGLSPILLGISLIVNTDAILWILMPLSLISFLIYQKENNRRFLYLASIILGLGILDKFVANFLIPFFLILIFTKYILDVYKNNSEKTEYLKNSMRDYLILIAIALVTIFISYPSAWVKPKELLNTTIYSQAFVKIWPLMLSVLSIILADIFLLQSIFSRKICDFFSKHKLLLIRLLSAIVISMIAFVLLNIYSGTQFYDFEKTLSAPKTSNFFKNFFSAFFPLLFSLTPLVLLMFLFSLALVIKIKNTEIIKNNNLLHIFIFNLFIFIYYLANSISITGSTVRYQIVNYPIASIIAAIGLYELTKKYFIGIKFYFLVAFVLTLSIISLAQTTPFFLAYSSKLLPKKFITNLKDMGDGSWEVSQYLNKLPNANQLYIWSDKKQICEKFIGKCNSSSNKKNMGNSKFDYLISSRSGTTDRVPKNKSTAIRIGADIIDGRKLYSPSEFYDFKISIDNRESDFIKVVNPATIPAN